MRDSLQNGLDAGLSDAEKQDLEAMIKAFKNETRDDDGQTPPASSAEDMTAVKDQIARLGAIISRMNRRMDAFYQALLLMHQKTEITGRQISEIAEVLDERLKS